MKDWRMNCPGSIRSLATRRAFLQQSNAGFGLLALCGMTASAGTVTTPLVARAKRIIFCFNFLKIFLLWMLFLIFE